MNRLTVTVWLIVGVLLCAPTPAHAEPISAAIGLTALISGIGVSASVAGAIGGAIITVGVSLGLNFIASKLTVTKKPAEEASSSPGAPVGVQTSLQIGGAVPRSAIFGRQATAGHFVYWNIYGANNEYLQLVYAIGEGQHDALESLYVNGKSCALGTTDGTGTQVPAFNGSARPNGPAAGPRLWVRFFSGAEAQAADAQLYNHANPVGRWTSNDRLAGISYVSVTLLYDEEVFQSGIPTFLFVIRGLRCYDVRLDSTAGGSGSHRWAQPTTYTWTDNPAVCLYNYQRGIYLGSELILGQGLAALDILDAMYGAAANACDELVTLAGGGSEKRYRVGMQVSADREHRTAIEQFLTAMAGSLLESAGSFGPIAGVAQVPALSFTDDDLIAGAAARYSAKRSRSDLVNALFSTFSDPSQMWQSVSAPPRTSSADELADGERLARSVDYPMIYSGTQAQRVAEIQRRLERQQATADVVLGLKYIVLEPGDWVTWQSDRFGFTKDFQVLRAQSGEDQTVALSLREIADSVFDWDEGADELDPQEPSDLPGYASPLATVASFALSDVTINGAGGLKIPALRATWSPISDRTIVAAIVEYRPQAQPTAVKQIRCDAPYAGEQIIAEGIQASTVYEARATIETVPARVTAWTNWIEETAPAEHVVPTALVAVSEIELLVAAALSEQFGRLRGRMEALETALIGLEGKTWTDKRDVRSDLAARAGTLSASITEVATVAATETEAVANQVTTVSASVDALDAEVTTQATALAAIDGKLAAAWTLKVDANGRVASIEAYADSENTAIAFTADTFLIALGSGDGPDDAEPAFLVQDVGGTPTLFFAGKLLANSIESGMIQANAITAGKIQANAITTGKLIADAAARIDSVVAADPFFYMDLTYYTLCSLSVTAVTGKYIIDSNIEFDGVIGFTASDSSLYYLIVQLLRDGAVVLDTLYVSPTATAISGTNLSFKFLGSVSSKCKATLTAGSHTLSLRIISGAVLSPASLRRAKEASIVAFEQRDNG